MKETPSKLKTIVVPIAELREDPRNARRHDDPNLASIRRSLKRFGQQKPIVINDENMVVAGHGQLQAARDLGWPAMECVRTKLPAGEQKAYAIADNRSGELSSWDDDVLAEILSELKDDGVDLSDVGFEDDDLDSLLGDDEPAELKPVDLKPPAMAWVLIGIPTVRFGEVSDELERIGSIPGVLFETSVNDDAPAK